MSYGNTFQVNSKKTQIPFTVIPFSDEDKKINSLFLSANFLENLGITNGKIGIAIYFFNLYRRTGNRLYEDFAFELLDEVDSAINDRTLVGFRFGLCGIGWGIEHLIRERYVGVDEDICAHFELRIQHYVLYDGFQGVGLANGLCGVLLYLLIRIESSLVQPDSGIMFTNKCFIIYVLDKLQLLLTQETITKLIEEQNNDMFGKKVPLVLSNWDYPVLLWALGRVAVHGILIEKTQNILDELLKPLLVEESFPKKENNKELLQRVLKSLLILELPVIKKVVTDLILKTKNDTEVIAGEEKEAAGIFDEFFHFTIGNCLINTENNNKYEH